MADTESLGRRYALEFWNEGKLEFADEAFAPDHEYHDPMVPGLPAGPEGVKQRRAAYMSVVPDAKVELQDVVATDDAVVLRWTWAGTHGGEFMGKPPTNRPVKTSGMHLLKVRDGKIVETWVEYDSAGIFNQMGIIALPG
jgi:steroid delta-isomerase-like uncharacterized protein